MAYQYQKIMVLKHWKDTIYNFQLILYIFNNMKPLLTGK